MNIFEKYQERHEARKPEEYTIPEYLEICKKDKMAYATAAERMLASIGDYDIVDTRKDPRLSRIFFNKKIKVYPAFKDFYGMEETIEQIVSFYRHAAQNLEENKQILYLLGPVGGGKSSLAEKLKSLMQKFPVYAIKAYNPKLEKWEVSPVLESPLNIFNLDEDSEWLDNEYEIPQRYLGQILSPWAVKRLNEVDYDLSKIKVEKVWLSILDNVGVTKEEPGDENNQDISSLVGQVNIRLLEDYDQNDPDAYSWDGGLNIANRGLLEFVEMFKAPIKLLHPLLTATQEGNYNGTEKFGSIPFDGIIVAHSNESEWQAFKGNRNNEAFLDRVYIVKVPYCLQYQEEIKIYEKLLKNSMLSECPAAPHVLELMSQFAILTRLKEPENSNYYAKMKVYNGEDMKDKDTKVKSLQEYKDFAGVDEGMTGWSTRQSYKILSKVYNYDTEELAANPVHLMLILEKQIEQEQYTKDREDKWVTFIKGILAPKYAEILEGEIQKAYLEAYDEYGQNIFDRYVQYADFWIQGEDFRDPDTGESFDPDALNEELEKIEKPAGVTNTKEFRNEIVQHVLRMRANNQGESPDWKAYEKLRVVIEKTMFSKTEDLLPIISFNKKASKDEQKKHDDFVARMMERNYTEKQVRILVEWYMRYNKHN